MKNRNIILLLGILVVMASAMSLTRCGGAAATITSTANGTKF